jgi:hypothetical protein
MSPNFLPTAGRFARAKDIGFQNQMRRALDDRYYHGAVWDDNPNGAVWDLDPRPQRFRSEFPSAPDTYDAIDAWLEADEALFEGLFGSAAEAPKEKGQGLQKFKEAVFDLVKKKPQGPGAQIKEEAERMLAQAERLLSPPPRPPLLIQTPAQQQADTTKAVVAAGAVALVALGIGYALGSRTR